MYLHSNSGRYAQVKHVKVKHLVQLVTLIVLFTWFLYQLNISHRAKVRSLRTGMEDEVGDEMLISLDNTAVGENVDESAEVAREEFIDKKSVGRSRKVLRLNDRAELEQLTAEGNIVSDMFLDDSGEGDADDRVRREEQGRRMDREIEGIEGFEGIERRAANDCKVRRGTIVERWTGTEKFGDRSGHHFKGESGISERQKVQNSVEADGGGVREDGRSKELPLGIFNEVIAEDVADRSSQKSHLNGSGWAEQGAKS